MRELILNYEFKDRLDRGKASDFVITNRLISEVREKLSSVHNWSNFCKVMGLKYSTLINLKDGRLQYMNLYIVDICEALGILLDEHYPKEEEADQDRPERSQA
jgi:hypothetical protein